MEDLDAAKLDDVKGWFQTYYGPANAVLAHRRRHGRQDREGKGRALFRRHPGRARPSRARASGSPSVPAASAGVMQDRVPQARIYKVWNVPQWGAADADYLTLAASVLSTGKSSRLYKRLVFDEQIATDVDASLELREIGGLFVIEAGVRPGVDPAKVERAPRRGAGALPRRRSDAGRARSGPRRSARADFIRGVERIGGFGGKSDVLAKGQVFAGPAGLLQGAARPCGRRHRGPGSRRRRALALGRRVHARGPAVPRLRHGGHGRRPLEAFPSRARRPRPSSPHSSAIRCRTASRSCSPSAARSRRCGSTCCSTRGTPPTSSRCPARPASR